MVSRSSSVSGSIVSSSSSLARPPLSKASTQLQLVSDKGAVAVRQLSMDTAPSTVKVNKLALL